MPRINAVSFHENPSIESICRIARRCGFDSLELSRPPFFYKLVTRGTRARFAQWASELGLSLYGFDCWVDVLPYTAMEATRDGFRSSVQFAAELHLGMIISHDPWARDNADRNPTDCLNTNVQLFRQVADWCAEAGLDLVFEPHPDTLSMDNTWCIDFIDGLERSNVGVLYDCCHYGVGQPTHYVDAIAALGHRIRHIHFSDGDRKTYALHLPIGEGELDLAAIVSALRDIRFQGTLTNDLFNYPLLEDGARKNMEKIRDVEKALDISPSANPNIR
jgi:sugar phosphate isomerase/epimerase